VCSAIFDPSTFHSADRDLTVDIAIVTSAAEVEGPKGSKILKSPFGKGALMQRRCVPAVVPDFGCV
jgi:hypothetical protein